jgi:hypothetical protein
VQQLQELIHHDPAYVPTHDELEAELELVDGLPSVLPDSTPVNFPNASQRLAHTMRRGVCATPAQAVPVAPPVTPSEHTEVLAVPPPRVSASASARAARMMQVPVAAPLLDDQPLPSLFQLDPEPRLLTEIQMLPVEAPATEAPVAAEPSRQSLLWRARMIVPATLLVLAAGVVFWLR